MPKAQELERLPAAILAGGRSSRMGKNKALLPLGNSTVIERIIGTVRPLCDPLFLVADFEEEYRFLGLPVYPDIYKNSGPLTGIHSALSHAKTDRVVVLSCDLPFVSSDVLLHLIGWTGECDALVLSDRGRIHPLCGIYRKRSLNIIDTALRREERSVQSFLRTINTVTIDLSDCPSISPAVLTNLNTPETYQACLDLITREHLN
ncbi:MAG: molybdenum cofactor guanylyltransferase [Ignavibacteria bacterium]|nr:molybdenum cofactor guanylyltransferase [Ignavibacteria bacterium]